jgi:hypothetical protein
VKLNKIPFYNNVKLYLTVNVRNNYKEYSRVSNIKYNELCRVVDKKKLIKSMSSGS